MNLSKMTKVAVLGAAVLALSAGAAFAATATASVKVRTGPGTQFRAIDILYPGERVAVIDRAGGWCAVEKSGPNGWVSCRYLTSGNVIVRPGVSIQFSFGNTPQRHYRDRNWDRDDGGYWTGPRSSTYSNGSGYFGLSMAN
ncbi:MAG: SH3 domain-containing protein [Devosia sp.]